MTVKEFYEYVDGDYNAVIKRMHTDAVVKMFLERFEKEPCVAALQQAVEKRDVKLAFDAAHTLKGLAANFSLDGLYQTVSRLVEQLRPEPLEIDMQQYENVMVEYEKVIDGIHQM